LVVVLEEAVVVGVALGVGVAVEEEFETPLIATVEITRL
jgi:hypothetical protein